MKTDIVTIERLLALVAVAALGGLAVLARRNATGAPLMLSRPRETPAGARRKAKSRRAA